MKNIIVTGGSKGLGLEVVKQLVSQDDNNVIVLSRSITSELAEILEHHKASAHHYPLDMSDVENIPQTIASIIKEHGPIYGLVNNAAMGADGILATQHNSDISKVLKVNLEAPIVLTKYVCRSMMAKKTGRIVNVSSIIASTGFHALSVYAASKSGLEGFTKSLSRELGKLNITVNSVAPGYMLTDMTSGIQDDKLQSIKRRAPLGLATPKDVAATVCFLLGDGGKRITGTTITVDGGSTA